MTDEQKIKAINSIWSNINKLRIAQTIYNKNLSYPAQIIEATGLKNSLIQKNLVEMIEAGTVEKTNYQDQKKNMVFYRLTPLGRAILTAVIR